MDNSNKIDYILQHINSLLTRDSDQILLEQLGIGYSQYKILRIMTLGKPVKQKFIANILGQSEASISRQINLLINKELISKTSDPHNKRIRLITITNRGVKLSNASNNVLNKFHKNMFEKFSDKQKNELLNLIELIHGNICSINHSPSPGYIDYLTHH